MQCTKCGMKMRCLDTRTKKQGRRRQYKCPNCNNRVGTIEVLKEEFDTLSKFYKNSDSAIVLVEKIKVLFENYESNEKKGLQGDEQRCETD